MGQREFYVQNIVGQENFGSKKNWVQSFSLEVSKFLSLRKVCGGWDGGGRVGWGGGGGLHKF